MFDVDPAKIFHSAPNFDSNSMVFSMAGALSDAQNRCNRSKLSIFLQNLSQKQRIDPCRFKMMRKI
jgi:hypothetical protein